MYRISVIVLFSITVALVPHKNLTVRITLLIFIEVPYYFKFEQINVFSVFVEYKILI